MYIQLRSIYEALYVKDKNHTPLLNTVREKSNLAENSFTCFKHPPMQRWVIPALRGKVKVVYSEEETEQIQEKLDLQSPVSSSFDFIRLHFHSVYEQIRYEFEQKKYETKRDNLRDFMRGPLPQFKGAGGAIRHKLLEWFSDSAKIREFVVTQWLILENYEYRPDVFRSCLIGIIDDAIVQVYTDTTSYGYAEMMQYTNLIQLRKLVLKLLSNGNDATALACMLLAGALGNKAESVIYRFQTESFFDCLQLTEDGNFCRQEMNNGYYLTFIDSPNHLGGRRKTDITLWKYPDTMIEKITDCFGYFFYPVAIEETSSFHVEPVREGYCIKYVSACEPFQAGKALFSWTYQPDGQYFEDDDGFGGTDSEEVILYAYLNEKGRFITTFSEKDCKANF